MQPSYLTFIDRVLNESVGTDSILKQLEAYKATGEHIQDVSRSRDGYQFNIKIQKLDIPDSVRKELTEDQIEDKVNDYTKQFLDSFMEELKKKYKWIGDIGTAGRSGGWLVMVDDEAIYSTIDGGGYDEDEEKNWIKQGKSRISDLDDIDTLVKEKKKEYFKTIGNKKFWKE